jgi:hypothetical protein
VRLKQEEYKKWKRNASVFPKISRTDQKNLACFNSKKTIKEGKSVDILPSFFYSIICELILCVK